MFKLIEFFKKRPSDKTILISRIVFGLLIIILLGAFFNDYNLNLPANIKGNQTYIKYALFILGLVPIIMGATNICIAKRKYVIIIQLIFGIVLIIVGNNIEMIQPKATIQIQTNTGSTNFENLTKENENIRSLPDIGFWIALLSIFPLLAGITGKCITSKCMKYKEIITKIRV